MIRSPAHEHELAWGGRLARPSGPAMHTRRGEALWPPLVLSGSSPLVFRPKGYRRRITRVAAAADSVNSPVANRIASALMPRLPASGPEPVRGSACAAAAPPVVPPVVPALG